MVTDLQCEQRRGGSFRGVPTCPVRSSNLTVTAADGRAWKHNQSKENEERYEKLQRETTTMVRKAKRRQERDLAMIPTKMEKSSQNT
jgi:hypothetical protein